MFAESPVFVYLHRLAVMHIHRESIGERKVRNCPLECRIPECIIREEPVDVALEVSQRPEVTLETGAWNQQCISGDKIVRRPRIEANNPS